jgi:hypothetical protein
MKRQVLQAVQYTQSPVALEFTDLLAPDQLHFKINTSMTTQISSNNIQPTTLAVLAPVTITSITVTNSSWTPLDDSAVSTSGGYIVITGTNFATGCNVIISSTNATSVAFVNSTTLRVQVPAMSAGTYVVYVTNTNGTTAIIVNGLTYSGTPTWVTESPLPQGVTGTPISIQLSATGDTPLTYTLQAGSTLPVGLTLSSGGLLSGSVDGLTSATTYNFTIEAIDPQLQDSPKAFAITIIAGDQFWDYVSLLLPGTTSTSIFNDDASTNNFPITVVGDTRPNNFGPYTPGYYSNFFDGTGDYLTIPNNTAFDFGTGDFTVEAWVNLNSTASRSDLVGGNTTGSFDIQLTVPTNQISLGRTNTAYDFQTTYAFQIGQWTHVAFSRSSGTIRCFVNGTLLNSASNSISYSQNGGVTTIGAANASEHFLNGFVSNLRIVKGTALYTASFTPSTTPLTAVAGTSLLTCQSNRFIDNSTNNFAITRNGDTRISGFDPFVPSSSTATLGSTYFDGTGDYLSSAGNTAFAMGTGDFTLEAWVYPTSVNTYWPIISQFASLSTGGGFYLFALNSSRQIELYYDGQTYAGLTATAATLNTWNHVTVTRQGSTIRGFINGVLAGTITYSGIFGTNSTNLEIGGTTRSGGNLWALGYISNARVVKGTAVYTANFTPPTSPLTAIANTSLLTCQTNQPNNNNMFLDSSTNNFLITRNGNTTQGTISPYAENWSNFFNGSTGYLAIPNNAAFAFGSGSLTVEAWIYTGVRTDFQSVIGTFDGGSNAWYIHTNASGTITYGLSPNAPYVASVQVCDNNWHHVAMVRNGASNLRFYVDGVLADSRTDSSQPTPAAEIRIGSLSSGFTRYFTGYISNVRVVKGTAVYTSNFTPSTTPLLPIANTSLLTCRDNSFVDDSANRFAITANGNTIIQKFGPFAGTTLPTPYYGAYFDGTGDHLTIPSNAAFNFSTEDLTIECWIYPTAFNSFNYWYSNGDSSVTALKAMYQSNGNQGISIGNWGGSDLYFTGASVLLNSWNHIAITRQSGTWRGFVNGVLAGSSTTSLTIPSGQQSYIGTAPNFTANATGYISNFRIVKGTAVYTTAFTPPTQPLTAVAGTSLLTCQSATFIDNSTNNFAITAAGNSQPTFFNPFTVTYSTLQSYSPSVFGGSMFFDGTGDFLTVPDNTALPLQMGTGDFTIEFWINFSSIASYQTPYDKGYTGSGALAFQTGNGNGRMIIYASGSAVITESGTAPTGTWIHYALVRRGTALTLYRDGTSSGTATNSTNFNNATNLAIGSAGAGSGTPYPINGYISDLRVVKGTAVYTSNFVPSNKPLTAVQNSVLLLNGTASAIYDASVQNNLETIGNAQISTSVVKFGTSSITLDGSGDYVVEPTNLNFGYGTGDFTIEFWLYLNSTGSQTIFSNLSSGSSTNPHIYITTTIRYYTAGADRITGAALSTGQWYHIALCRASGSTRLFVNGTQSGSTYSDANNYGTFAPLGIGTYWESGAPVASSTLNGYISDLRITRGIARYTANFTPPTTPLLTN